MSVHTTIIRPLAFVFAANIGTHLIRLVFSIGTLIIESIASGEIKRSVEQVAGIAPVELSGCEAESCTEDSICSC